MIETESALGAFLGKHNVVQALPENSLRIVRMCNDPDCSISQLQKVISQDAALVGRILQAVNSAAYALPQKIVSLDRAISFMGLRAVKEVTLSSSLNSLCRPTPLGKYDARDLWDHGVAVAVMARELAIRGKKMDPEEAFLAGMLHDIGLLLAAQSEVNQAREVFANADAAKLGGKVFLGLETRSFGFHHCQLGERLASEWKFPDVIATAIRWHHEPSGAPESQRTIAEYLYVADSLCCQTEIGCPLSGLAQPVGDDHLQAIGVDAESAATLAGKIKILVRLFMQ